MSTAWRLAIALLLVDVVAAPVPAKAAEETPEFARLGAPGEALGDSAALEEEAADVTDLPLIEVPAGGSSLDEMVVHLTGDGGWGVSDRKLARALSAAGVPVVGWNSLRYFWKKRTPDEAAHDLGRILLHYLSAWHRQRAILVGYSFGADVLPKMFNLLPPDLQTRVSMVALLGPSSKASFHFHVEDWIGADWGRETYPVVPEIERMAHVKILCLYGRNDKHAICPGLDSTKVTILELDGGHRIAGHAESVAREILRAAP